jgi:hypothetical protein
MGMDCEIRATRRRGVGWHAITSFLLLAFALQSFLTQTHIHGAHGSWGTPACVEKCVTHVPAPASPFDSTATCPLCQAIVHAGAFFVPGVVKILVPHLWLACMLPVATPTAPRFVLPRSGLSRAPPR